MYTWEQKTLDWVRARLLPLGIVAVAVCALSIRFINFGFHSKDYDLFLLPWFEELKAGGGLRALGTPIGNYNVPYLTVLALLTYLPVPPLYSIKAFSVVFDFVAAAASARLVFFILQERDKLRAKTAAFFAFAAVLLLPTVLFNSAYWAQCDSVYAAFLLLSLVGLVRERYTAAFVLFSVALAFKLQALLFLPVLVLLYITRRRFSVLQFFWIPAVFAAGNVPALLAGRGFLETFTIYFRQAGEYPKLTMEYPNIYYLLRGDYHVFSGTGIAITLSLFVLCAVWLLYSGAAVGKNAVLPLALWVMLTCLMFLPSMHERYGYVADILSVLCFLAGSCRWYVPFAINLCSLLSYTAFLFRYRVLDLSYCALVMLAVLAAVTVGLCGNLTEKLGDKTENFT